MLRDSLLEVADVMDGDLRRPNLARPCFGIWFASNGGRHRPIATGPTQARIRPQANTNPRPSSRLLDLWERQGARERIAQLQNWCEHVGHHDGLQMVFARYRPDVINLCARSMRSET